MDDIDTFGEEIYILNFDQIIRIHKGLTKQRPNALDFENQQDIEFKDGFNKTLSRRSISFCRNIKTSEILHPH